MFAHRPFRLAAAAFALSFALSAQPPQQALREGKLDEALAAYQKELAAHPDSVPANNGAGVVLDLMGKGIDARQHFQKAIDLAPDAAAKANGHRQMAMSFAFEGDCRNTVKFEQMAIAYWATREQAEPQNAFYQEGEMANEAARVCIDAGDLEAAATWYAKGTELGLKEPGNQTHPRSLWQFRLAHAQARIAARRGDKAEARKYVAVAKAALDGDPKMAEQQARFFPYLTGYVALYTGDAKLALEELQKAVAMQGNDPFLQCLIGMTYEKLGDKEKAMECYRKASTTTGHNPPAAFARPFTRKKLS